jgi:hypothetical protein
MNLTDHREEAEIAARADATLLKTRSCGFPAYGPTSGIDGSIAMIGPIPGMLASR